MNYFSIPGLNRPEEKLKQAWHQFTKLYPQAADKARKRSVLFYRYSFYKIMRDRGHSWTSIARLTGQNHATVINAYDKMSDMIELYREDRKKFNQIKEQI